MSKGCKRMLFSSAAFALLGVGLVAMVTMAQGGRTQTGGATGNSTHTLEFGGRTRTYEVHIPRGHDGKSPLPVVLNLHGGGGNATVHRRQSQMDAAADRDGYIVVYPEGTSGAGRFYTWNAGLCCGYAMKRKVDDVGFINALLDDLPNHYAVDADRVYATGMSNGAMMAYRLACELPHRITAICGVASTMGVDGPKPDRPVPIMQIHGLKDENAKFAGGVGPNAISRVNHKNVREVIRWWCEVDHCDPQPVEVVEEKDYTMERYAPRMGEPGAPIVLYMLKEGGHTWPGGVDVTPRFNTGKLIASFDADKVMWEFFQQFSLSDFSAQKSTR
jgi:polyhydroxybutyrate depolymerase